MSGSGFDRRAGQRFRLGRDLPGEMVEPDDEVDGRDRRDAVQLALRHARGGAEQEVVFGCEPATLQEGMGLSAEVAAAVEPAARLVREVIARERRDAGAKRRSTGG